MSKQSEAKLIQAYEPKPIPHTCVNCVHFYLDKIESHEYMGIIYFKDKNLRCNIGGFAVKKTATCNHWSQK